MNVDLWKPDNTCVSFFFKCSRVNHAVLSHSYTNYEFLHNRLKRDRVHFFQIQQTIGSTNRMDKKYTM